MLFARLSAGSAVSRLCIHWKCPYFFAYIGTCVAVDAGAGRASETSTGVINSLLPIPAYLALPEGEFNAARANH